MVSSCPKVFPIRLILRPSSHQVRFLTAIIRLSWLVAKLSIGLLSCTQPIDVIRVRTVPFCFRTDFKGHTVYLRNTTLSVVTLDTAHGHGRMQCVAGNGALPLWSQSVTVSIPLAIVSVEVNVYFARLESWCKGLRLNRKWMMTSWRKRERNQTALFWR